MTLIRRVVFDTSTLVSAALRVHSIPARALAKALEEYQLCSSKATLQELQTVLLRPKFDRYLARPEREAFVALMNRVTVLWTVQEQVSDCRDPHDNKFLALAIACQAERLISSDEDLLILNPYRGIPIVRPQDFL
jgi:putative PIN family toxin of toxin-antitoxin system